MGFMDKVGSGIEQATRELEKALDKGKTKVGEMQLEMQMDGLAKKLGYMVFDTHRGRTVDQAAYQKLLDDLSRLEDQVHKVRAEKAAKSEAAAQAKAAAQQQPPTTSPDIYSGGQPSDSQPSGWNQPQSSNPS